MPTILSMKDRIKLTLNEMVFTLKPLTVFEMNEVQSFKKMVAGVETEDILMGSFAYLKFCLKDIKGVSNYDGTEFELEFEGEYLTEDCVNEIFTLNLGEEFLYIMQPLKENDTVSKPLNFRTGKPLKDVKLEVIRFGDIKN